MGKHSGESAPQVPAPVVDRARLLRLAVGITATLVAWGFLVWVAIDFGGEARGGNALAWVFLGLATVGATACLFVTLILGSKILAALQGVVPDPKPATAPPGVAGKRAAR